MRDKPWFQFELASLALLTLLTATALGAFGAWGLLAVFIVTVIVAWARLEPARGSVDEHAIEERVETADEDETEERSDEPLDDTVEEVAEASMEVATETPADVLPATSPYRFTVPFRKGVAAFLLFAIAGVLIFGYIIKDSFDYSSRRQNQNSLERTAALLHRYVQLNGQLPRPSTADGTEGPAYSWWFGNPEYSWRVVLARYFEGQPGYYFNVGYRLSEPWNGPYNARLPDPLGDYQPYKSWRPEKTDILAVTGSQTAWATDEMGQVKPVPADRQASTILLIKDIETYVHWAEPCSLSFEQARHLPSSLKQRPDARLIDGIDVSLADGTVVTISPDIPHDVWDALLSPKGPPPAFHRYLRSRVKVGDWLAPLLFVVTIAVMLFRPQRHAEAEQETNANDDS